MRARVKRAIVPCLALVAAAATLVGVPAAAQTDGAVRVVAFPSTSSDSAIRVAAIVSVDLCAKEGSITLPGTADPVPIWGFALKPTGVPCTDASVVAGLPGPVIIVDEGDVLTVTLHNALAENVSLAFPGQNLMPDFTGAAPGGTAASTFTVDDAGTYLYASGENPSIQVPMGLYGALVVRSSVAGTAYGTAASSFNREGVLVLSEIDLSLNADPGGFNPLDWHPTYWLINGKSYPDTTTIPGTPGGDTLLRYVNAGLEHHTPRLLGLYQQVFAKDATPLNFPFDAVAETIPAGQTADMIVEIPGAASVGQTFPLYSRQLHVTNGDDFPGGMLTFLEVQAAGPRPVVGVDIRSVSASSRAHRVRVSARTVGCSPCEARARLRAGGSWRAVRMSRVDGEFVGVFRNVQSGMRAYQVTIEDLDTGISVASERRFIRVR
jgi:FtsP/CotA-like multicopper oxidase with cupredoxin domain